MYLSSMYMSKGAITMDVMKLTMSNLKARMG